LFVEFEETKGILVTGGKLKKRQKENEKDKETFRDGKRQTEIERDRKRQKETTKRQIQK
jgi:hypothetical protein